jgi:diguanylate cyclase (GGDEF)-like protein
VSAPDLSQILETLNLGVFALDAEGLIVYWNRWMENASGRPSAAALGKSAFGLFPELETPVFRRDLKSVLSFGNFAYFSQKVHGRLLNLSAPAGSPAGFERMEQSCVMGPIREGGKVAYAYVVVEDVTEVVARERRLSELAMKDVLTSAYNRRYFDRRLAEELERCRRYGRALGLVMLDIDFFKNVNDRYGHQFGDAALCAAVSRWTKSLRASDLVARYGGEEFCVLLPEANREESLALAERLRASIACADVSYRELCARITVSAGVAFFREGDSPDDILRRSDEALYRAKAAGRDRVEASH